MSKIQLTELSTTHSELNLLSNCETTAIVGGREIRNLFGANINIAVTPQFNIANTIIVNFGDGPVSSVLSQVNIAGTEQQAGG